MSLPSFAVSVRRPAVGLAIGIGLLALPRQSFAQG